MIEKLHHNGTAILLISHDMELVEKYTNRLVVMDQGKIILDEKTEQAFLEKQTLKRAGLFPVHLRKAVNP